MKFIIDRSKWRSGSDGPHHTGSGETRLLNDKGYMCCLGMVCEQLGVHHSALLKAAVPQDLILGDMEPVAFLVRTERGTVTGYTASDLAEDAMYANDRPTLSREDREKAIVDRFAKEGHEIEFIGSYSS